MKRFKNILVETESHLLTVARYIPLNPVKAGMVARPEEWAWSSYRARAGSKTLGISTFWMPNGKIEQYIVTGRE